MKKDTERDREATNHRHSQDSLHRVYVCVSGGWRGGICLRVLPDDQAIKPSVKLTIKHELVCREASAAEENARLIHAEALFPSALPQLKLFQR